jgi:hypothetical protein
MQYETCRHIKEDGAYCGSPAQQKRKYCYYHLAERGRRLRRARALRDNTPYRLEIGSLDSLFATRAAIAEIVQALGSGQLDHRTAGKMLYGIQQATALNRRMEEAEAAAAANPQGQTQSDAGAPHQPGFGLCGSVHDNDENSGVVCPGPIQRVQECPQFEQEFGLDSGTDIDAEIARTLHKAEQEIELRQANLPPPPPPGMRLGAAQYKVYCEEAYQMLSLRVNHLQHELRDYYAIKRRQSEKEIAEMLAPAPPLSSDQGNTPKKPAASAPAQEQDTKQEEATTTA